MDARALDDFEVAALRADFPALSCEVNGKPLVYLDSASTAQKPRAVLDAVRLAYEAAANVHRAVHTLGVESTRAFEGARAKVAALIGARDPREIVFVRGTTEAVNLVAQSYGRQHVREDDEIIVSQLEHHSNIVPWQMLCREKGARLEVLEMNDHGEVMLDRLDALLGPRTRLVAVSHVSNSLGTVLPVAEIARRAKSAGAVVFIDGAQAAPHVPVDVGELGCDFYAFSGHKLYGPTGVGVLWGRRELLEAMPPWQGGGDMVRSVRFGATTYGEVPHKFEAGTPHIAGVIGLGAAVDWLAAKGLARVRAREGLVLAHAARVLGGVPGLRMIGTARHKVAVLSFTIEGVHPHDLGTALDVEGIAVRTGQHCAQPVMEHFGVDATVRASLGVYSTTAEIDILGDGIEKARALLRGRR